MPTSEKGTIRVFNTNGQLLYRKDLILNRGVNNLNTDWAKGISAGLYYIKLETTSGLKSTLRLIRQ